MGEEQWDKPCVNPLSGRCVHNLGGPVGISCTQEFAFRAQELLNPFENVIIRGEGLVECVRALSVVSQCGATLLGVTLPLTLAVTCVCARCRQLQCQESSVTPWLPLELPSKSGWKTILPLMIRQWTLRHKALMRGAAQGSVAHSCALRFLPWAFQERNSRGVGCQNGLHRKMPSKKSLLAS